MRFRLWPGVVTVLLLSSIASRAGAEEVVETWRSTFGLFRGLSVNAVDGSCWVSSGSDVLHLDSEGQVLARVRGLARPIGVSANPTDGSCWVAETGHSRVLHLAADGTVLTTVASLPATILAVSPADGSCAVAAAATDPAWYGVVRLAEDGAELWRRESATALIAVQASPADGSWWVARSNGEVTRLWPGGTEAWHQALGATSLSVDSTDGSAWVTNGTDLIHLSADGNELWRLAGCGAVDATVDSFDGTVWMLTSGAGLIHLVEETGESSPVTYLLSNAGHLSPSMDRSCWLLFCGGPDWGGGSGPGWEALVHFDQDCRELWRTGCLYPTGVTASPSPASCWVNYYDPAYQDDSTKYPTARLASDGTMLAWTYDPIGPFAANFADGSTWMGMDSGTPGCLPCLVHLAADATELLRMRPPVGMRALAVNPTDNSCWIADGWGHYDEIHGWMGGGGLAHVAADGSVLFTVTDDSERYAVSVNPADGSVWVVTASVHHLDREGTELFQYAGPSYARVVSVDPEDGSCWVGGYGFVAHLAADGSELWRSQGYGGSIEEGPVCAVAVNTFDGTCWVTDLTDVVHLAPDGTELSRTPGFDFSQADWDTYWPSLSANPLDGSCWVADTRNRQVARLAVVGYPVQHFFDAPRDSWAFAEIEACVAAGVVRGFPNGSYRPSLTVARDQMAVYVARALALPTGDSAVQVPSGTPEPTFPDVDAEHWAYRHVEFCVAHGIVQGYPDGHYHPDETVNRGQMAVYIARALVTPSGDAAISDPPAQPTFPDVTADNDWSWCYPHVEYLAAEEIVQGYSDGYRPGASVTRDQMAVYIARAFHLPL